MGTGGAPPSVLPTMGRVEGPAPDAVVGDQLVVIRTEAVPRGLALLDSPDFDSLFEDHYEFATKLMAARRGDRAAALGPERRGDRLERIRLPGGQPILS